MVSDTFKGPDYFTASWQCIEEREDHPSDEDPPVLATQYLWGLRYIDDLVQRQRDTTGNGVLNETLYALSDRQFNVVALADTSGGIVKRIAYTPYGTPTFLTSAYGSSTNTYNWQHLFQGLRTDAETGLIQNRNRVLHPLLGRFLQRDPLGYPDGLNAYAAYHVMRTGIDPMGMEEEEIESHFTNMKCCTCLLMGEAEGESMLCKRAVAHVLRNRQKLKAEREWPSSRNESDYCDQAGKSPGTFEGGKGNRRYKKCDDNFFKCPVDGEDPYNEAERKALEDSLSICESLGDDPTNGAQYFMARGAEPDWLKKAVKIGMCAQVDPKDCGNVFYRCNREPLGDDLKGVTLP